MYEIWNKTAGFNLADGTACTVEEIKARYPFTANGTIIIEKLENGNVGAIDSLDIIKGVYSVDATLSDEDALAAIEAARNAPPEPSAEDERFTDFQLALCDIYELLLGGDE